jgi:transcription antitermination factor NusG
MTFWAAVRTVNQREALGVACLSAARFEVVFPRVKASGRIAPLFANYLFVALGELGEGWTIVNRTLGVLKVVAFGDRPARVPDQEIACLKGRIDANTRLDALKARLVGQGGSTATGAR